jgi:hypothetical protein
MMKKIIIFALQGVCLFSASAVTFDPNSIYVSTFGNGVMRFNATTGAYIENAIPASAMGVVAGIAFAPDGKLWAVNPYGGVSRFNESGLVDNLTAPAGTWSGPEAIAFGPDGNAYVVDIYTNSSVLKFNGSTGAFMGKVIDVAAAVPGASRGMGITFGPDGKLNLTVYKTGSPSNLCAVERFDPTTYAWLGTFSSFIIDNGPPKGIAYGRGGTQLAVTGYYGNMAYRFDGATGGPGAVNLTGISRAVGIAYGADDSIYVVSELAGSVVKFDSSDARNSTFITGLAAYSPEYIAFIPPAPKCGDAWHPKPIGDFNGDCSVDFKDFKTLVQNWLACTDPSCGS